MGFTLPTQIAHKHYIQDGSLMLNTVFRIGP